MLGKIDMGRGRLGAKMSAEKILSFDVLPAPNDTFCQEYLYITFAQNEMFGVDPGVTEVVCLANYISVMYSNVSETAFRLDSKNLFELSELTID